MALPLAMYHLRWPYVIVWHLVSRMELLCVWVKKKTCRVSGSWVILEISCVMWPFYSLTFWINCQSLWNADAVLLRSWGNNIYIYFQAAISNMISKLLHLHFVCPKTTSQNRVQTLAFMPILDLTVGLRMDGSSQHTEQRSAAVAQDLEGGDWSSRTCQKQ